MSCVAPKKCFLEVHRDGSKELHFSFEKVESPVLRGVLRRGCEAIEIPCAKCLSCQALKRMTSAVRLYHESSMHSQNSFVSLTIDNDHLREVQALCHVKQMNLVKQFIKKVRRRVLPVQLRYYFVKEYGEKTGRLHFHAFIYGADFMAGARKIGEQNYSSPVLNSCWRYGHVSLGTVTFQSAMYLAKHSFKAGRVDTDENGKEVRMWRCSNRGGSMGKSWCEKYRDDIIRTGKVIIEGQSMPLPARYLAWYENDFEGIKNERIEAAKRQALIPEGIRLKRAKAREVNLRERLHRKIKTYGDI